jgi:hypothetical protein
VLENDAGFFFPASTIGSHTLADDSMGHVFKLLDPEAECIVLLGTKYYFAARRRRRERNSAVDLRRTVDPTSGAVGNPQGG